MLILKNLVFILIQNFKSLVKSFWIFFSFMNIPNSSLIISKFTSICVWRCVSLNRFLKKLSCYNVLIIFLLTRYLADIHRLIWKNSKAFLFIFVVNCQFLPNNSVRICSKKLKIDTLCQMKDTFRNTMF